MASLLTNTHIRTLQASIILCWSSSIQTHSSDPLFYHPLNEDHFPIAQKHDDSSQNDPLQIMSPVTLASAHEPSRAPHYSQNRSKIFSWPQSYHVMTFSCSFLSTVFFSLWAPARDQKAPSSRSLFSCFSFIFRKARVPCFASFAPLGILYFPEHTDIK